MLADSSTPTKTCSACGQDYPTTPEFFPRATCLSGGLRARCRQCHCAAKRRYYQANRDKVCAAQRSYTAKNKAKCVEYGRAWQRANPEKRAERNRRWAEAHPEQLAEARCRYQQAHLPEHAASEHRRRARKHASPGEHTPADVAAQRTRQHSKCFWCRERLSGNGHVDHVIPLSRGGSNGPENLVIACPSCNCSKSAKHPMDFAGVMF